MAAGNEPYTYESPPQNHVLAKNKQTNTQHAVGGCSFIHWLSQEIQELFSSMDGGKTTKSPVEEPIHRWCDLDVIHSCSGDIRYCLLKLFEDIRSVGPNPNLKWDAPLAMRFLKRN